jgi:hypothetical protein
MERLSSASMSSLRMKLVVTTVLLIICVGHQGKESFSDYDDGLRVRGYKFEI